MIAFNDSMFLLSNTHFQTQQQMLMTMKKGMLMNLQRLDTTSSHTVNGFHRYLTEEIRIQIIKAIIEYIIFPKTTTSRL